MLKYKHLVGRITFVSGIIGLLSYFLVAGAVNFNFEFFSNPKLIFQTDGVSIVMLKWSMITDILGYYLLLLPLLFYLREWMTRKTAWSDVFTFCGGAYIFAGALGAAILGATWPVLLDQYPSATSEQQQMIAASFETLSLIVASGIWNLFDALVFAVWFVAIGFFLRQESAFWSRFTVLVGLLSALDFMGNALGAKALADLALNLYLVLAPIWAIAFGWALYRNNILKHTSS